MISREQSINAFIKNADEVISSNYILASKKISIFMKGISSSKIFYELFEFCVDGFDYEGAKKRYLIPGANYGDGKFVLPIDAKSLLSFVFLLLYEIDSKEIDLLKLLEKYFFEGGYNESFKRFANEVIIPFKTQTLCFIRQMIEGTPEFNTAVVNVKKAEKPVLSLADTNEIKNLLSESKAIILQYKMEQKLKKELLVLYDNFSSALDGTDAEKLKIAFLGYKYSTLFHRKLDVGVEEIENILQKSLILDEND